MSPNRILLSCLLASVALAPIVRAEPAKQQRDLTVAPVAAPASPQGELAAARAAATMSNAFGTRLLNTLLGAGTSTSVVVSPYSVNSALDMLTRGAVGPTATVLRVGRGVAQSANADQQQSALNHALAAASTPEVIVRLANSAWLKPDATPLPAFVAAVRDGYGASVENVDLSSAATVDKMNAWVKQNTENVIERIVDRIDPATEFLLINTTYFKGKWAVAFDKAQTGPAAFTRADGSKHDVAMMSAVANVRYAQTARWHAVALPYQGERFEMIVMTAKDASKTAAVRQELGQKGFLEALRGLDFAPREVDLRLPRFRAEYGADLTVPLSRLGLGAAFAAKADYGQITKARLQSTKVVHRAVVDVNEEGTEAAAVTAVVATRAASAAPARIAFAADRPFVFGIVDRTTGAVLFIGYIADPPAAA
jgi:serpin B